MIGIKQDKSVKETKDILNGNKFKRILSLLLVIILVIGVVPVSNFNTLQSEAADVSFNDSGAAIVDVSTATNDCIVTITDTTYTDPTGTHNWAGDIIIKGNKGVREVAITINTSNTRKIKLKDLTANGLRITYNNGGNQYLFLEGTTYITGSAAYTRIMNTGGTVNIIGMDNSVFKNATDSAMYEINVQASTVNTDNFSSTLGRVNFTADTINLKNSKISTIKTKLTATDLNIYNSIIICDEVMLKANGGVHTIEGSLIVCTTDYVLTGANTNANFSYINGTSGINFINSSLITKKKMSSFGSNASFEGSSLGAVVNNALPVTKDSNNYDGMARKVYPVYIRVPKVSLEKVKIRVDNWEEASELYVNTTGDIYPLVTEGKHTITIETQAGKTYTVEVEPNPDSTTDTPVVPVEMVMQSIEVESVNASYTYKFDADSEINVSSNSSRLIQVPKTSGKSKFTLKSNTEPLKLWTADVSTDGTVGTLSVVNPSIVSQSQDVQIKESSTAVLSVVCIPSRSENSLQYAWYRDSILIPDSNTDKLIIDGNTGVGTYCCSITESNGLSVSTGLINVTRDDSVSKDEYDALQNKYDYLKAKYDELKRKYDDLVIENAGNLASIATLNERITELEKKITDLENNIADKSNTITELTNQVNALTTLVNNYESLLNMIKGILNVTTNEEIIPKIQEILDTLDKVREDYSSLSAEYNEYKISAETTIANLNDKLVELQAKLDEKELELGQVKSELADALVTINSLTNLINQIKTELGVTEDSEILPAIQELKRKYEELKIKYDALVIENATNTTTIVTLTERIAELETLIIQLEADATNNTSTIKELQDKVTELTSKINEYETLLDSIKALLEVTTNDEILPKIQDLLNQLDSLRTDYSSLNNEYNDYKNSSIAKIDELTDKISKLESDLINKNRELEEVKRELADTQTQITDLRSLIDLIKNELGVTEDTEIIPAIKVLKDRINNLSEKVTELQDKLNNANDTINDLTNDKNSYIERLESIRDLVASDNTDNIEDKIQTMKDLIAEYEEKIAQLEQEKGNLEKVIADQEKEIQDLKEALSGNTQELLDKINELEKKIQELENKNAELTTQVSNLKQNINELTNENVELKKLVIELQTQLETANSTIDELRSKVTELTVENELLKDENKKLKLENEELKKHTCQSNEELLKEIDELNKKIEELKSQQGSTVPSVPTLPDNGIIVQPTTTTENIVNQDSSNVSAEKGWELSTDISSTKWSENIDMSQLYDTQGVYTFYTGKDLASAFGTYVTKTVIYAREKSNPNNVFVCSLNLDLDSNYKSPSGYMTSDTKGVEFVYDESNTHTVKTTDQVEFNVTGEYGKIGEEGIYYKVVALSNDFDPDGTWKKVVGGSFKVKVEQPERVYIKYVDKLGNYTVNKTTVLDPTSAEIDNEVPVLLMDKTVYLNNSYKLRLDTKGKGYVDYTVADKNVATVSGDGSIKAKKIGKTKVTFKIYNDNHKLLYKYEITVTVKESKNRTLSLKKDYSAISTGDSLLQSYKQIVKGKTTKLGIKASKDAKIMYINSDKSVATVNKNGVVEGKSKGVTDITVVVYQNDKFYTYIVKVRVSDGTKDTAKKQYLS